MATMSRAHTMSRIFLVFAVVCALLAGYLFFASRDLAEQYRTLTAETRQVERSPHIVRKQLRRTQILAWAAAGGAVLLVAAARFARSQREAGGP